MTCLYVMKSLHTIHCQKFAFVLEFWIPYRSDSYQIQRRFFHIFISVNRSAFTLICGFYKFKLLNDWVSQCPNVQFEPYFHISSDLNNELQGLFLSPFLGTSGPILIYFSIPHQKDKNTNYFVFLVKMH